MKDIVITRWEDSSNRNESPADAEESKPSKAPNPPQSNNAKPRIPEMHHHTEISYQSCFYALEFSSSHRASCMVAMLGVSIFLSLLPHRALLQEPRRGFFGLGLGLAATMLSATSSTGLRAGLKRPEVLDAALDDEGEAGGVA